MPPTHPLSPGITLTVLLTSLLSSTAPSVLSSSLHDESIRVPGESSTMSENRSGTILRVSGGKVLQENLKKNEKLLIPFSFHPNRPVEPFLGISPPCAQS